MYSRKYSGQNVQTNKMHTYNTQIPLKQTRPAKYGIPKPKKPSKIETNFSNTNNYQINNNYIINTSETESLPYTLQTNRYRIPNPGYTLTESNPTSQTDRYHKDTVIVYQRKIKKSRIYNNNSFHFIKQNIDNDNNQDYPNLLDDYNDVYSTEINPTYNPNNIIKRGTTPKMATNDKPRTLRHNFSSKTLFKAYETEINIPRENDNEIFNNNKRNYRIVNVKHTSNKNLDTFNITTPNNTRIHTIVCSSKNKNNDNNSKTIPLPQKLFSNTERKVITIGKYVPERNIQREIEEYFFKNRIRYANRQKYINAALLIQTTFREFKKNGKIKFNFIKKYVKFYRAVNLIQNLFKNKKKLWKLIKDKMIAYAKNINKLSKRKVSRPINKLKDNDSTKIGQISKMFDQQNQNTSNGTKVLRHQSRDLTNVNVEKIIKENEDLQKLLNDVMKENSILKSMNLNNKDLLNKNLALKEKLDKTEKKTKQLQIENEQYLSEYAKAKNKYSKIEGEVADVNKKLKITYLKFIIEKKEIKRKQILNKYFKRYKETCQKLMKLEKESSDTITNTDSNSSLINLLSSAVKTNTDAYVTKKSEEEKKIKEEEEKKKKKQEELMRKRNKILIELFYNKDKERTRFIHSCFSKFYYKGMINQYKFRKSAMLDRLRESKIPLNKLEEEKKKREEEERKRKEEEERKKKEEEEKRIKEEEERKKKEEEEKKKKEEEERIKKEEEEKQKKEEEEKKAEDDNKSQEQRRINKLNMDRRRKLKKLFQEEKNRNLEIKRKYFKKFHFKAFFFASHYFKTKTESKLSDENNDEQDNSENQEKSLAQKMKEEQELKEKQEREELIKLRNQKLQSIIFKKDRKYIIIKKNIMQRWNLTAKLISLGPKKKLRGRSKRRGDSKRGDSKKKAVAKKPENEHKNLKIKKDENDDNSEDEKDKDKDDEKKTEETNTSE